MAVTSDQLTANGQQTDVQPVLPEPAPVTFKLRPPMERIQAEAEKIEPRKAVLTMVAGLLFGIAWILGRTCRAFGKSFSFTAATLKVGWKDGTGQGPSKSKLLEDNAAMRAALKRMGGDVPR